jgi:flavin reductase (DIM6/NTAB) family NADH-FMN oxidoreductase RutF
MGQQHGATNIDSDAIDPKSLRRAAGQFATGATIVTFKGDGDVRATTANSFTLLSLDPPLVLVCVGKTTNGAKYLTPEKVFSVSILRADQKHFVTLCRRAAFGSPAFAVRTVERRNAHRGMSVCHRLAASTRSTMAATTGSSSAWSLPCISMMTMADRCCSSTGAI